MSRRCRHETWSCTSQCSRVSALSHVRNYTPEKSFVSFWWRVGRRLAHPHRVWKIKAGFHMIADDRGSQIAESSAIVCDHMETHFCDRLRSCDRDYRRSQKIEPCSIIYDRLRSSAIICDRLRSCNHMETKVLRSAIEMYPIIFLILTDNSTLRIHKARIFVYSNAHLL